MSTINRLSSVDVLQPSDQIPVWDSSNGDTRKASMSTLLAFVESYFADPDYSTRIVAPAVDYFTVDIGATGDSIWMIVNPTLNFTNGAITLPPASSAVNDQQITVVFTSSVSTFVITSSGATVLGAPTQINGYDSFSVRYNSAQQTWYNIGTTGSGSGSGVSQIVRQDFTGDGTTTTFALLNIPSALGNELQIFIDGVYQERAGYTVSGVNIIFSEAPPSLSNIEVLGWAVSLGAETSSDLVSYTPAGIGAVLTTVQAKLREYVSVLDFGADPTGVTDSTAAIQAAHDASVAGSYQTILFPAGAYKFTSLTWSPHVGATTSGKVYLETALASGNCIHISDEYGLPSRYGLNSVSSPCWSGQFYLINSNGVNTATAWAFGGTTAANFCALVNFRDIETRGFLGGYHKYLYNAFALDFYSCFDENNGGNHISLGLGITNSVTQANYISCRFGSGAGYLFSLNNASAFVLNMTACECVFLTGGFIEPGNTAALGTVYYNGGNVEWTQVAAPHIDNDTTMTLVFNGTRLAPQATSGWPTPVISRTQGSTTTSFINCKHVLPGAAMPVLHTYPDAASRGVLDYAVDWYGGNTLNIYYTAHASAVIGFNGIREAEETYTPAFSGTLGDGSITGKATRVGNRIDHTIFFTKGSTTTFAAVTTFGLTAVTSIAGYQSVGTWYGNNFGVGDISGITLVGSGATSLVLKNMDGTNVSAAAAGAWGSTSTIACSFTIFV